MSQDIYDVMTATQSSFEGQPRRPPMWVVQEYPDSYRVMRTHENGQPVAEPVEVKRFERTGLGFDEAHAYIAELSGKKAEIDEVLAVEV